MKIPHPALGKKFCTSGEFRLAKNTVAVAAYLLVRMESRLEELTNAIKDLQVVIANKGGA